MSKTLEHLDILLRIERQLGKTEAVLNAIQEDTKEIKQEAKYTNGKIIKLRKDVDAIKEDVSALYQSIGSTSKSPSTVIGHTDKVTVNERNKIFSVSWEKLLFIFGSIATIIAFVIERLKI